MALIQPDSPLDKYLREAAQEEQEGEREQPKPKPKHPTKSDIMHQAQLSERLKYLICSSFLLNPNLDPAFYNSHPATSTSTSTSDNCAPSTPTQTTTTTEPSPPIHPPIFPQLGSSRIIITLVLICSSSYLSRSSFLLSSIPIFLLTFILLFPSSTHKPLQDIPTPQEPTPQESQFRIQSELIPQVAQLVSTTQALDLRLSRAIGAVKEIECVARGFGLSNPMPPISRLENATFSLATSPVPFGTDPDQSTLHALGVRKVLQRVLDQLRHDFETTTLELEAAIVNPGLNPSASAPTARSTLSALMVMYGCSRGESSLVESQNALKNSATERARRRAWRASHYSRNKENQLPHSSSDQIHLNSPATTSNSRRLSWQTPPPAAARSVSDSFQLAHLAKLGHSSLHQPRSRASFLATPSPQSLDHSSRRLQFSPIPESDHQPSSGSRPLSIHVTASTSPTAFESPSSLISSARPRPVSMSAASPHTLTSSILFRPRKSVESYPNIHLESPSHLEQPPLEEEEPAKTERVIPYSLNALLNGFERMHISRKRLMCCLLALDFTLFAPPTSVNMWQDTLEAVGGLLKTFENLSAELTNGMTLEFGPGSFENSPSKPRAEAEPGERSPRAATAEQEAEEETAVVRDFGPPVAEAEKKTRKMDELGRQMAAMDRALRTISAKMKVCMEELSQEGEPEGHGQRAIGVHESIRADLESLAREWDESRSKIRTVVEGEKVLVPGKSRLRNSMDSNEGSMSVGHGSSVYSSELLTPVGEDDDMGLYESGAADEAETGPDEQLEYGATVRSQQPMVAPPRLEEILREALQEAPKRSGGRAEEPVGLDRPVSLPRRALKLTAEEHQELRRRRRESLPLTPRLHARPRPHSLLSFCPASIDPNPHQSPPPPPLASSASSDFPSSPAAVVSELKDVLVALKSKRLSQAV